MTDQEVREILIKEVELIEEVMGKLEIQNHFLNTPHMKGLNRVLTEQAVFIDEIMQLYRRLNEYTAWEKQPEFQKLKEKADRQYGIMVEACQSLLEAAVVKRKGIAAEIVKSKQQRTMKHNYIRQWQFTAAAVRPRFNVTG